MGRLAQDVLALPKQKFVSVQLEKGSLQWRNDVGKEKIDQVIVQEHGKEEEITDIRKKRPDEFYREIIHIDKIMRGEITGEDSPISLKRGLDTMAVLASAHKSFKDGILLALTR